MGEMGVGSRGAGDFFVHRRITDIVASTNTTGKITLTIECDETFTPGGNKSIVIDAATGAEDTTNQQS
jgi:hydrogenase maturation factor HypE